MTYRARLNRAVFAIPRTIRFMTIEAQMMANIKSKAQAFIKANPQPRAMFLIG